MHPLRLFWWQGRNFGDELSRLIIEQISKRPVKHAPPRRADVVGLGSLLETHFTENSKWSEYGGTVWGTGRMHGQTPLPLSMARVQAVRGHLTLKSISCRKQDEVVLGDPGLLVTELMPRAEPEFQLGVIPHLSHRHHPMFRSPPFNRTDVRIIDVSNPPEDVLADIARCGHILSSSLHGLVVADAMGIPNCWLWIDTGREQHFGVTEFKFRDYYSVFNAGLPTPLALCGGESMDFILARMRLANPSEIEMIRQQLRESFPKELCAPEINPLTNTPISNEAIFLDSRANPQPTNAWIGKQKYSSRSRATPTRECVILVLAKDPLSTDCKEALQVLESRGYAICCVGGYTAADQARSQLATEALRQGFEELMWIGRDIVFDPDAVERLRAHQKSVVGGVYPHPTRREFDCEFTEETQTVRFGSQGGLLEIESTGLGFLHTRRVVYDSIIQKFELPLCNRGSGEEMLPFFLPEIVSSEKGSQYLTGEQAFCAKIRSCGFPILADTTIRLSRISPYGFGWEDAGAELKRYRDYVFHLRNHK